MYKGLRTQAAHATATFSTARRFESYVQDRSPHALMLLSWRADAPLNAMSFVFGQATFQFLMSI